MEEEPPPETASLCPDPTDPIVPWPNNANREVEVALFGGHTPTYYVYRLDSSGGRQNFIMSTTDLSGAGIMCAPTSAMAGHSFWYSITTGPSTTLYLGRKS